MSADLNIGVSVLGSTRYGTIIFPERWTKSSRLGLFLAAALHRLLAKMRAALGAGIDVRLEVEHRQRLAHLATVRAGLELVELERLLRPPAEQSDGHSAAHASNRGGERGGDVERSE